MEILIVSEMFYPKLRGGEVVLWRVARGLAERGHGVRVLTARLERTETREVVEGIEIIRPCRIEAQGKSQTFGAFTKKVAFMREIYGHLKEEIEKKQPDVIYDNAYTATFPAGLAGRKFGVPVVTNIGNLQGSKHFGDGSNPVIGLLQVAKEVLAVRFGGHRAIRVASESVGERVRRIGAAEVFSIPTPIEDDLAAKTLREVDENAVRKELGLEDHELFLLYVGAIEKVKNLGSLLQALPELSRNFKFFLAGKGREKARLESISEESGISEKVIFLGEQEHEQVFQLMRAADAFLLPSRSETGPLVVIEALSVETPVISTDVGVVEELDSPNLTVVDKPEEMIEVLEQGVESHPDDGVRERFSMKRIAGEFERMFETVVGNGD